jgi:hypothetical protein
MAGPNNRPAQKLRYLPLPTQERRQVRPIRSSYQSEESARNDIHLRPNVPTRAPPPHTHLCHIRLNIFQHFMYPIKYGACHRTHMGCHSTLPGAPQNSVFDRLGPSVQDRLGSPQSGHQTQVHRDCRTTHRQIRHGNMDRKYI